MILDAYVYRNLRAFGNAYIDYYTYEKLGKRNILSDLLKNGFNCTIEINKTPTNEYYANYGTTNVKFEKDVIISVVK